MSVKMEIVGVYCQEPPHEERRIELAMLARRPGERYVEVFLFGYGRGFAKQLLNAEEVPAETTTEEVTRTRLNLKCPVCDLHVVKRWPDETIFVLVNGLLDAGVSELSLKALAARVQ